jgi:hypothetical protein
MATSGKLASQLAQLAFRVAASSSTGNRDRHRTRRLVAGPYLGIRPNRAVGGLTRL